MVDVPVLIAGGGPVGVTLAMDLAYRGIRSIIIDKRKNELPNPRCNTTNARSMEIFRRLGCADAVRGAGLPAEWNTDVVYLTRMTGVELTRYERSTPADWRRGTPHGVSSTWPTPEPQHFISQIYVEPVLRAHARDHYGVEILEGWELTEFAQDAAGVHSVAVHVETGERCTFRSTYLVGADGGGSAVRTGINARLEGQAVLRNTCSIYMRAPRLSELARENPGWMYRFVSGVIMVAIDGGDEWLVHNHMPEGADVETFDPEPYMFDAIGEPFDYEVIGSVRWTARAMVSNKYREGRVFLAGDAAHIWIPMGGFGMNAGVADATSLGWMLAGVLDGWLDPKILDAYETERAPLGELVATHAAAWWRDLATVRAETKNITAIETDPDFRRELGERVRTVNLGEFENAGMQLGYFYMDSPIIAYDGAVPPEFSLETYQETSRPGVRAPHIWREGGKVSLFDQFGPGFTLLRIGAQAEGGDSLAAEANERGIPFTIVDVSEREAVRKYEGFEYVLVRPDGHIAWRGHAEPAVPKLVLDRVTGVLIPERPVEHRDLELREDSVPAGSRFALRGGRLIYVDAGGTRVIARDTSAGTVQTLGTLPGTIGGFAFLQSGTLVVCSPSEAQLFTIDGEGRPETFVDLRDVAKGALVNIASNGRDRLYVADLVKDANGEKHVRTILVDETRGVRVVLEEKAIGDDFFFTADGNTFVHRDTQNGNVLQARVALTGDIGPSRLAIDSGGRRSLGIARTDNGDLFVARLDAIEWYDHAGHLRTVLSTPENQRLEAGLGAYLSERPDAIPA
jgi:2-polyprenyl-6-methoxyphenol hydroxylase-like FAD-dependent oxidoreductase/sugar lactone lactonase YvrE